MWQLRTRYIIIFVLTFIFSYFISSAYTLGDQVHYRRFYELAAGYNFQELFLYAHRTIGSIEPISLTTIWLGAKLGIPKDIYISFLNSILTLLLFLLLERNRAILAFPFLALNYYILVLFCAAERLKIGYIFLILSSLLSGFASIAIFFISIASHYQLTLLIPSIILDRYYTDFVDLFFKFKIKKRLLSLMFYILIPFSSIFILFNLQGLQRKIPSFDLFSQGLTDIAPLILLTVAAVIYCKPRLKSFIVLSPFYAMTFLIVGDRINIMAFTYAALIFIRNRQLFNPISLISLTYLTVKYFTGVITILQDGELYAG